MMPVCNETADIIIKNKIMFKAYEQPLKIYDFGATPIVCINKKPAGGGSVGTVQYYMYTFTLSIWLLETENEAKMDGVFNFVSI